MEMNTGNFSKEINNGLEEMIASRQSRINEIIGERTILRNNIGKLMAHQYFYEDMGIDRYNKDIGEIFKELVQARKQYGEHKEQHKDEEKRLNYEIKRLKDLMIE